MLYAKRNNDLVVRTAEYQMVVDSVLSGQLFKDVFPEVSKNIGIDDVFLVGQSYGGTTVL